MNSIEHNLVIDASNLAPDTLTAACLPRIRPDWARWHRLTRHWPEYLMEATMLGAFMVSACVFGALYEFPQFACPSLDHVNLLRRLLMGVSMGLTAIAIIYSPWGKQSGAHINPSMTLTFLRLGKIKFWDALFYMASQFAGAVLGVMFVALFLSRQIADPAVRYVVTVPGPQGVWIAWLSEFVIAFVLVSTVLYVSNHHRLDRFTGLFAGLLVATYITLEAPFSGMSMNPARTFGSAVSADVWDSLWIYLTAPPLGMLSAAELYLWRKGRIAVKCCKLDHTSGKRCIFCGANGGFES